MFAMRAMSSLGLKLRHIYYSRQSGSQAETLIDDRTQQAMVVKNPYPHA